MALLNALRSYATFWKQIRPQVSPGTVPRPAALPCLTVWSLEGSWRGAGSRRLSGCLATRPQPLHQGQRGSPPNPSHLLTSSWPELEATGVTPHCSGKEGGRGRPSEEGTRGHSQEARRAPCPGPPHTGAHVLAVLSGSPDAQPRPRHRLDSTCPGVPLGCSLISAHFLFTYSPDLAAA